VFVVEEKPPLADASGGLGWTFVSEANVGRAGTVQRFKDGRDNDVIEYDGLGYYRIIVLDQVQLDFDFCWHVFQSADG